MNHNQADNEQQRLISQDLMTVATFVACVYEQKRWIGIVKQKSKEYDYLVSFMASSGVKSNTTTGWQKKMSAGLKDTMYYALLQHCRLQIHQREETALQLATWNKHKIHLRWINLSLIK